MATPATIAVLTPLQCAILKRLAEGATRFDIAKENSISHKTAEYHRAAIQKKLQLDTLPELTMWAIAMGIVNNPFRNETPNITVDMLVSIDSVRKQAHIQAITRPALKKVLKKEPLSVEKPPVSPAKSQKVEGPTLEGRLNHPLTSRVEAIEQLKQTMPITPVAEAVLAREEVRGKREQVVMLDVALKVPEQEQKVGKVVAAPPEITEREHGILTFKPSSVEIVIPKQTRTSWNAGNKKARKREPDAYVKLLSGKIDIDDDKWCEFNPHKVEFEAIV